MKKTFVVLGVLTLLAVVVFPATPAHAYGWVSRAYCSAGSCVAVPDNPNVCCGVNGPGNCFTFACFSGSVEPPSDQASLVAAKPKAQEQSPSYQVPTTSCVDVKAMGIFK